MITDCPDPGGNPDDCVQCGGWGHKCSAWRAAHPDQIAEVETMYETGWDPTRLYNSVEDAQRDQTRTTITRFEDWRRG